MKRTAALFAILAVCSVPAMAQNSGFVDPAATLTNQAPSGFNGPITVMTVEKAKTMKDDTWVTVRGNIEQRIGDDHYTFRDASGTMTVDIDNKRWNNQTITPKDIVELQGEIDKDWNSVELEVKKIVKVQ